MTLYRVEARAVPVHTIPVWMVVEAVSEEEAFRKVVDQPGSEWTCFKKDGFPDPEARVLIDRVVVMKIGK